MSLHSESSIPSSHGTIGCNSSLSSVPSTPSLSCPSQNTKHLRPKRQRRTAVRPDDHTFLPSPSRPSPILTITTTIKLTREPPATISAFKTVNLGTASASPTHHRPGRRPVCSIRCRTKGSIRREDPATNPAPPPRSGRTRRSGERANACMQLAAAAAASACNASLPFPSLFSRPVDNRGRW